MSAHDSGASFHSATFSILTRRRFLVASLKHSIKQIDSRRLATAPIKSSSWSCRWFCDTRAIYLIVAETFAPVASAFCLAGLRQIGKLEAIDVAGFKRSSLPISRRFWRRDPECLCVVWIAGLTSLLRPTVDHLLALAARAFFLPGVAHTQSCFHHAITSPAPGILIRGWSMRSTMKDTAHPQHSSSDYSGNR